MYPVHIVVDNSLFTSWGKTPKRQFCKNTTRSITAGLCVIATILLGDNLDKFLSILGALTCTPIAFIFPALFHFKAGADSQKQKIIDGSIVVIGIGILFYCTTQGVLGWGGDDEVLKIRYQNFNPSNPPHPSQ